MRVFVAFSLLSLRSSCYNFF